MIKQYTMIEDETTDTPITLAKLRLISLKW
jgi:hypothetical protein